jgi:hypothetical protein
MVVESEACESVCMVIAQHEGGPHIDIKNARDGLLRRLDYTFTTQTANINTWASWARERICSSDPADGAETMTLPVSFATDIHANMHTHITRADARVRTQQAKMKKRENIRTWACS